jgi:hypothetical protein
MTFPVHGMAAIEDCSAGPGACYVNCGKPCSPNEYRCSWPNFSECSGAPVCDVNPPIRHVDNGCGKILWFYDYCTNRTVCCAIQDCGPEPGQYSTAGFCNRIPHELVACINTAAFSALCGLCNPLYYGLVRVRVCGTGCNRC